MIGFLHIGKNRRQASQADAEHRKIAGDAGGVFPNGRDRVPLRLSGERFDAARATEEISQGDAAEHCRRNGERQAERSPAKSGLPTAEQADREQADRRRHAKSKARKHAEKGRDGQGRERQGHDQSRMPRLAKSVAQRSRLPRGPSSCKRIAKAKGRANTASARNAEGPPTRPPNGNPRSTAGKAQAIGPSPKERSAKVCGA